MVNFTMEQNDNIIEHDETYGFEGGKVVFAVPTVYHFDKGDMAVPHRIIIHGEKKQAVEIRTQNGYDALLKLLKSKKGQAFRNNLAITHSLDSLEESD